MRLTPLVTLLVPMSSFMAARAAENETFVISLEQEMKFRVNYTYKRTTVIA